MLGWPELVLIFVVLLLVVGPSKMPEMARTLGHAMREFRKATSELEQSAIGDTSTNASPMPAVQDIPTVGQSSAPEANLAKGKNAGKAQEELENVAQGLGIVTEGKSREQIRKEILEKVNEMGKNA